MAKRKSVDLQDEKKASVIRSVTSSLRKSQPLFKQKDQFLRTAFGGGVDSNKRISPNKQSDYVLSNLKNLDKRAKYQEKVLRVKQDELMK